MLGSSLAPVLLEVMLFGVNLCSLVFDDNAAKRNKALVKAKNTPQIEKDHLASPTYGFIAKQLLVTLLFDMLLYAAEISESAFAL